MQLPYGYHILWAPVLAEFDVLEGPDGNPALAKRERRVGEARVVEHGGAEVKRRAEALVCLVGVIEAVDENLKREGWEVRVRPTPNKCRQSFLGEKQESRMMTPRKKLDC